MPVIPLTTVGSAEVHPLSAAGRVFTMTLILLGVVAVFDLLAVFAAVIAGGELSRFVEGRAMRRRLETLKDHYVICAFGRVGRAAAQELAEQRAAVVVIEADTALEPLLVEFGVPYLL